MEKVMENKTNSVMEFTGNEYDLFKKAVLKRSDNSIQFEVNEKGERVVKLRSFNDNYYVNTVFTFNDGEQPSEKVFFDLSHLKELKIGKKDSFTVSGFNKDDQNMVEVNHEGMKVKFPEDKGSVNIDNFEADSIQNMNKEHVQYLKDVNKFTSKSESRPVLCGINFNEDYLQATDSHFLKKVNVNGSFDSFTVHNEAIDIVTGIFSKDFTIETKDDSRVVKFEQNDGYMKIEIFVNSIDGNYPVTDRMIPEASHSKTQFSLNSEGNKSLEKTLSRMNVKDHAILKLSANENDISFMQKIEESKKTKSISFDNQIEGDQTDIHLNIALLKEISSQSEELHFHLYGKMSPLLFLTEDKNVTMLISPVRVY